MPAGGAEYLATTLEKLRAEADAAGQKTLTVGAGDMVGATPLLSAAFHDEPTIETLNLLQMDVTSVGNHEFDEGVDELLRLQNGGCHPTDGCQDGDPFFGADFPYLAANTVYTDTGETILPAWTVRKVQGVSVGFIGMTLEGTPSIVNPAGITEVDFLDEIETANQYADELLDKGVEAIVLLIHEGGHAGRAPDAHRPVELCQLRRTDHRHRRRPRPRVRPGGLRSHAPALRLLPARLRRPADPRDQRGQQRHRWSPISRRH